MLSSVALAACGATATMSDAAVAVDAADAVHAVDATPTDVPDASDAIDVPPADANDVPPVDAEDVPPADATDAVDVPPDGPPLGTCDTSPIMSIASRQSVRFHFPTGTPVFVVTGGMGCGAFAIAHADTSTAEVPLGLPFQCICECPRPIIGVSTFVSLMAASMPTITWDAREMHTCTHYVDCAMRGWPGEGYQAETEGFLQPVESGHYRATFIVYDTLPSGCSVFSDGSGTCGSAWMPPGGFPSSYELCSAPGTLRSVSVEFDLPAAGDVDVMVPVM